MDRLINQAIDLVYGRYTLEDKTVHGGSMIDKKLAIGVAKNQIDGVYKRQHTAGVGEGFNNFMEEFTFRRELPKEDAKIFNGALSVLTGRYIVLCHHIMDECMSPSEDEELKSLMPYLGAIDRPRYNPEIGNGNYPKLFVKAIKAALADIAPNIVPFNKGVVQKKGD